MHFRKFILEREIAMKKMEGKGEGQKRKKRKIDGEKEGSVS